MRKIAVIIGCLISLSFASFAQDIIITKYGSKIEAKILEIRDGSIWFKFYENQQGSTYSIAEDTVSEIIYEKVKEPVRQDRVITQPNQPTQTQRQGTTGTSTQRQSPRTTEQQRRQDAEPERTQRQTRVVEREVRQAQPEEDEYYETYEQYRLAQERRRSNSNPFRFGVKAGLNMSSLVGYGNVIDDYSADGIAGFTVVTKPGFHVGLTAQFMFTPEVGLETGLMFSTLGTKFKYSQSQTHEVDDPDFGNFDVEGTTNTYYVQIPVSFLYKFNITDDFSIYPSLGLYAGYGIYGTEKKEGVGNGSDRYSYDTNVFGRAVRRVTENGGPQREYYVDKHYSGLGQQIELANRFDAGWTVGATAQYTNFIFGVGFSQGFTSFDKDAILWDNQNFEYKVGNSKLKNRNFNVSVGYLF
ncbi:MAG: PorT family protein [Tannerella sp.]|jgi:hypothetical protein|nr:PorT family protein [Tannerella sp.]